MRRVGYEDLGPLEVATAPVVRPDHQDPGELTLGPGRRLERDGAHAAHLAQRLLELPEQPQGALRDLVGRERVKVREAGQPRRPLVDLPRGLIVGPVGTDSHVAQLGCRLGQGFALGAARCGGFPF